MNTKELFEYGITPKTEIKVGNEVWAKHGDRLMVESIGREDMLVSKDGGKPVKVLIDEVELWQEPKTLFDDCSIRPTWGNLKNAMETEGLGDDTEFLVVKNDFISDFIEPATFRVRRREWRGKKCVVVE